jgi:hypothetical protein
MDRLEDIFLRQVGFQYKTGNFPLVTPDERQKFISEQILALIVEAGEAIQETQWKSWKKMQVFNKEKFKEEIIDCWHFLINISLTVMTADEFYDLFVNKNEINIERQKNKY